MTGCFAGFLPAFNTTKCYSFSTSRMWWGVDSDCKFRTGYFGGLAELKTNNSVYFAYTQMAGIFYSPISFKNCHFL